LRSGEFLAGFINLPRSRAKKREEAEEAGEMKPGEEMRVGRGGASSRGQIEINLRGFWKDRRIIQTLAAKSRKLDQ